jgi:hypothetical protein
MNADIFYQDFMLNVDASLGQDNNLILDEDKSQFIATLSFDVESEEEFADAAFREMNIGDIPNLRRLRPIFKHIGHTSMSIGDYIKFDDGTILICKSCGWKTIYPAIK